MSDSANDKVLSYENPVADERGGDAYDSAAAQGGDASSPQEQVKGWWLSPILWPYTQGEDLSGRDTLQFSPEHFRFWAWTLFLLTLGISGVLTTFFAWHPYYYDRNCSSTTECPFKLGNPFDDNFTAWDSDSQQYVYTQKGPLEVSMGYNNLCIYLDFAPASWLAPFLWVLTMLLFTATFFLGLLRARTDLAVSCVPTAPSHGPFLPLPPAQLRSAGCVRTYVA